MVLYAELEMAHGLIMVYRNGRPTPYSYSNVQRSTGRKVLVRADWELLPPNSFRLQLRSGPN